MRQLLEEQDRGDAGTDENDLSPGTAVYLSAVEIGNEIRHRDVEKTRRREGQHLRPDSRQDADGGVGHQGAGDTGGTGDEIETLDRPVAAEQYFAATVPAGMLRIDGSLGDHR